MALSPALGLEAALDEFLGDMPEAQTETQAVRAALERAARAAEPELAEVYRKALAILVDSLPEAREYLAAQDPEGVVDGLDWQAYEGALWAGMMLVLSALFVAGLDLAGVFATAGEIAEDPSTALADHIKMQLADWTGEYVAARVAQLSATTRAGLRTTLADVALRAPALRLVMPEVQAAVGLTPQAAGRVTALRTSLAAAGSRSVVAEVEALNFAEALVEDRGATIAEHETWTAVHAGVTRGLTLLDRFGLVNPDMVLVWRADWDQPTDPCDDCAQLDGLEADVGGHFEDGGEGPPYHPRCRCWLELVPRSTPNPAPRRW